MGGIIQGHGYQERENFGGAPCRMTLTDTQISIYATGVHWLCLSIETSHTDQSIYIGAVLGAEAEAEDSWSWDCWCFLDNTMYIKHSAQCLESNKCSKNNGFFFFFFCHSCFIGDSESIPDPEIQLVASGTDMEDNMALTMPIKIVKKKTRAFVST